MATTNFNDLVCDSLSAGAVSATSVSAPEIGGRTKGVLVIPTMATADVTLTAAQKKNAVIEVTTGSATNILTLGLAPGESIIVKNNDTETAVKVKNIAADTAFTISAGGAALIAAGTGGAMIAIS